MTSQIHLLPRCLCVVVWHINRSINHFILLYLCTTLLTCLFQPAVIFAYHWMMSSEAVNPQLLIFKIFVSRQFSRIWSSAPSRCKWKQERVLRSRHAEHATIIYLTSERKTSLLSSSEATGCFHFLWLGDFLNISHNYFITGIHQGNLAAVWISFSNTAD